jgi:hypothetical protein
LRLPRDDASQFLSRITPYVEIDGARNLGRIARDLALPYQTILSRMVHLKDRGIGVIPIVDVSRLSLERVRASFKVNDLSAVGSTNNDETAVKRFFSLMNNVAGLRYFSRSVTSHLFDCEFNIPKGKIDELSKILAELEARRILRDVSVHKVLWKDFMMLKTNCFDYECGEWDVDFSRLSGSPSLSVPEKASDDAAILDYKDMLIIKELEIDPWAKISRLAGKIGMPARDVSYHMKKHVLDGKMIPYFRFQWIGTREAWSKHTIMGMTYEFDRISDEDARHAMSIFTSLPFCWSHLRTSEGGYMAEVLIPVAYLMETTRYVSKHLRSLDLSPSVVNIPDWDCSSNFTIPYQLYDKESNKWSFSAENAIELVLQEPMTASPRGFSISPS